MSSTRSASGVRPDPVRERGPRYAVGDIHGHASLLEALLEDIRRDAAGRGIAPRVVFLGDYVDRGPASRQVIDLLLTATADLDPVFLMGNHEDMMLQALADPSSAMAMHWASQGGLQTLQSYGWDPSCGNDVSMVPDDHVGFLRALGLTHDDGTHLFVHAGVRPGVPLARQSREDLLWIREDFLHSEADFGRVVVHGHTPRRRGPEIRPNRVNLDTGAFFTGVLTAALFVPGKAAPEAVLRTDDPEAAWGAAAKLR